MEQVWNVYTVQRQVLQPEISPTSTTSNYLITILRIMQCQKELTDTLSGSTGTGSWDRILMAFSQVNAAVADTSIKLGQVRPRSGICTDTARLVHWMKVIQFWKCRRVPCSGEVQALWWLEKWFPCKKLCYGMSGDELRLVWG